MTLNPRPVATAVVAGAAACTTTDVPVVSGVEASISHGILPNGMPPSKYGRDCALAERPPAATAATTSEAPAKESKIGEIRRTLVSS